MNVDYLIVGAGFSGAVLAERLAKAGKQVLLVDKRDHIAGNAYDEFDEHGVLVHRYGPHIFHTNAAYIWRYLAQFTQWRSYYHEVLAVIDGHQVPIPFNLNSIEKLFPAHYAEKLSKLLIKQFGYNVKVPILKLREQSNGDLDFLADYIYKNVFHGYTLKQWELTPEELGSSVMGRVPVYISRDNRYFQDSYQGMPTLGYTQLFRNMLKHPNIRIMLNTDYQTISNQIKYKHLIYTGPIDEYFEHKYGELPYRSVHFEMQYHQQAQMQAVGTVNVPNEYDYTRTTDMKILTGQIHHGSTLITEHPQAHIRGENDPYYPIPKQEYRDLYRKYKKAADKLGNKVIFAGRLGSYQYYNMDQAIASALSIFDKLKS